MLHRHDDYLASLCAIADEFNALPFWLGVLDEMLEPSSLNEEFNGILQWMESSVTCPWHLWKRQYFVLLTPFLS